MRFDIVLTNTFMKCIIANLYLNACKWSFSSVLSHIQFQFKEELDENGNFTEHLIPNSFNYMTPNESRSELHIVAD